MVDASDALELVLPGGLPASGRPPASNGPRSSQRNLLLSNRDYDDAPFRLVGVLLIVLGLIVVQIIRHRLEVLYTTTLVARVLISLTLIAIYVETDDPFFLVILAIVVFGIALTGWSYLSDRRHSAP